MTFNANHMHVNQERENECVHGGLASGGVMKER